MEQKAKRSMAASTRAIERVMGARLKKLSEEYGRQDKSGSHHTPEGSSQEIKGGAHPEEHHQPGAPGDVHRQGGELRLAQAQQAAYRCQQQDVQHNGQRCRQGLLQDVNDEFPLEYAPGWAPTPK